MVAEHALGTRVSDSDIFQWTSHAVYSYIDHCSEVKHN